MVLNHNQYLWSNSLPTISLLLEEAQEDSQLLQLRLRMVPELALLTLSNLPLKVQSGV